MVIPGYRLLSVLGEGGSATVWRARQESLDRDVAVKILRPELTADPDEVQAFLQEARSVAQLNNRHIVRVIDAGQHQGSVYLVMEYINGQTVQEWLEDHQPISRKHALKVALAVAEALAEAWDSRHIIHRDIKPANILVDRRGEVKVADLGLAGIVDAAGRLIGNDEQVICGTPNYMSPEQAGGSNVMNFSADMYSLGAVLYHMMTRRMPFEGRGSRDVLHAQVHEQLPNPRDLNPKLPQSCVQLMSRLMMKDPGQRYPDWSAVMEDINRILQGRRVLVMTASGGVSTIADARGAPAAPARKELLSGRSAAQPDPLPSGRVPLGLRLTLNLILLAGLGGLVFSLLWLPRTRVRKAIRMQEAGSALQANGPSAGAQAISRTPQSPDERVSSWLGPPPAVPVEADAATTPAPTVSDERLKAGLETLTDRLVELALTEGVSAALASLGRETAHPALTVFQEQHEAMLRILRAASNPNGLIAGQFEKMIGMQTYVNVGKRRVFFRIEAVNGETVKAALRTPVGSGVTEYTSDLNVNTLEPAEKRRWLAMGHAPEHAFTIALADLLSGQPASARERADACGPFAGAIRRAADARLGAPSDAPPFPAP